MLQHEVDHLDGVLFPMRMRDLRHLAFTSELRHLDRWLAEERARMSEAVEERRALKDKLLEAALLHAAFDGWSRRTLLNAAKDAGVDPATARRLFPHGGDSLLEWLDDWADRQMLAGHRAART